MSDPSSEPVVSNETTPSAPTPQGTKPKRRRLWKALVYCAFLFLLLETGARVYLKVTMGGAVLHPDRVTWRFFRELKFVQGREIKPDNGRFDVLVLGGSVLNPNWGHVETVLLRKLQERVEGTVRIHNLAAAAHTSRDSLIKYKRLRDKHFDVVCFYHGINETRTNNCPPDFFRKDYSHYLWYRKVNTIDHHPELPFLALPFFLETSFYDVRDTIAQTPYLMVRDVREDWLAYGRDVKSAESFRSNLGEILEIAQERQEPVVLMTFAYYVADGYSKEKFDDHALDYAEHVSAIELWGNPANVIAGIVAHNNVVRELAAEYGVSLIDQEKRMPTGARYYKDVCHFTLEGSQRFVEPMVDVLLEHSPQAVRQMLP